MPYNLMVAGDGNVMRVGMQASLRVIILKKVSWW
uniref:Uncharacterized protein n=1 Tax=Rhizophora mucronata TaxID=61149 RepID=A0A2P2LS32_RHIMU